VLPSFVKIWLLKNDDDFIQVLLSESSHSGNLDDLHPHKLGFKLGIAVSVQHLDGDQPALFDPGFKSVNSLSQGHWGG